MALVAAVFSGCFWNDDLECGDAPAATENRDIKSGKYRESDSTRRGQPLKLIVDREAGTVTVETDDVAGAKNIATYRIAGTRYE